MRLWRVESIFFSVMIARYVFLFRMIHCYCSKVNLENGKLFGGRNYGANAIFHEVFKKEINSAMCLFTDECRAEKLQYAGFGVTVSISSNFLILPIYYT